MLGESQSGFRSSLQNLRVLRDEKTIVAAREEAEALLDADPDLAAHPDLAAASGRRWSISVRVRLHGEVVTRIIGGTAGGRRLEHAPGRRHPPTSDRVREALFSAVESWCGSLHGPALPRPVRRVRGRRPRGLVARRRRGDPGRVRTGAPPPLITRQRRGRSASPGPTCVTASVSTRAGPAAGRAVRPGVPRPALPPARRRRSTPTSPRCATTAGWCPARWSSSSGPPAARP